MKQDINHSFGLDVILSSSSPKNHSHVNSPVRQNLTENRRNKNMKDNNHITFNFLLNDSKTETQNKKMYKLLEKESNRKQNQERSFSIGSKRNIETTNMDSNEPEPKRQRMNVHDEISRGQWSQKEHDLFLQGLEECGRGRWKEIASRFVTSRTARQISSHAQKYFIKVNAGSYTRRESVADQHPDEAYDHGRSTSSPEWLNSNNFFRFCYGKRRKRKTQDKNREHENVSHESKGREEPLEEEEEKENKDQHNVEPATLPSMSTLLQQCAVPSVPVPPLPSPSLSPSSSSSLSPDPVPGSPMPPHNNPHLSSLTFHVMPEHYSHYTYNYDPHYNDNFNDSYNPRVPIRPLPYTVIDKEHHLYYAPHPNTTAHYGSVCCCSCPCYSTASTPGSDDRHECRSLIHPKLVPARSEFINVNTNQ